jgi:hypothetical protein
MELSVYKRPTFFIRLVLKIKILTKLKIEVGQRGG